MQTAPLKANRLKLILDYDYRKIRVHQFDENVTFTCRRKTVQQPLLCVPVVQEGWAQTVSKSFFEKFEQQAHSSAVVCHTTNARLSKAIKEAALVLGFLPDEFAPAAA